MTKSNTLYFLLFFALIMGAFSAMAQNGYGITILGGVCFAFSLIFFWQLVANSRNVSANIALLFESVSLGSLAFLLGLRVFYIRFNGAEWMFAGFCALLLAAYLMRVKSVWSSLGAETKGIRFLVFFYFLSIVLFIIAMVSVPLFPAVVEPIGMLAFGMLLTFCVIGYAIGTVIVNGERTSGFAFVYNLPDRSLVVLLLFFLFSLYMGLTKINFLPTLYSDEYPAAYFKLLDDATKKREKPVNGSFRHDEFKKRYESFIQRNVK